MRNIWNECLNKVELGGGWRYVKPRLPADTSCPSGAKLLVEAAMVFIA